MKRFLFVLAAGALLAGGAGLVAAGGKNGGEVLPASATTGGYSLEDMAAEMALFSTSGNDPEFYPDTPFQILYVTETNSFTVRPGTSFFVPVAFADNSPPILGDFPTDPEDIPAYIFGEDQLGGHDLTIVVDGKATRLGPDYAVGVGVPPPGLLDGGGSDFIQIGAFLAPLSKGDHTITIKGTFDGAAVLAALGGPLTFEVSYAVKVRP